MNIFAMLCRVMVISLFVLLTFAWLKDDARLLEMAKETQNKTFNCRKSAESAGGIVEDTDQAGKRDQELAIMRGWIVRQVRLSYIKGLGGAIIIMWLAQLGK